MKKFYVYTISQNDPIDHEFVEEEAIKVFAEGHYNPAIMEFTGVIVEAEDFDRALAVYKNPACGFGEYIMADEPIATSVIKQEYLAKSYIEQSFKQVNNQLDVMRCVVLLKLAIAKMLEANLMLNRASEFAYEVYDKPDTTTPKKIFDSLSEKAIKDTIKYNGQSEIT